MPAVLCELSTEPPGIRLVIKDPDMVEMSGPNAALLPAIVLSRANALSLAYRLGELAQRVPMPEGD